MPEEKKESNVDIKGTFEKFIKAEEPELEQEEAIMKYGETDTKKKKKSGTSDDTENSENSEEQEHIKRVKQELLASLKRVDALAKKVFEENPLADKEKINVKVDKSSVSGGKQTSKIKEQDLSKEQQNQKERE